MNQITINDDKRFSLKTIHSTEKEKQKLISEMTEYNKKIRIELLENLKKQIDSFNSEYKELIYIHTDSNVGSRTKPLCDNLFTKNLTDVIAINYLEDLHFTSTKHIDRNRCNSYLSRDFTVRLKTEKIENILSDQTSWWTFKIVGMEFIYANMFNIKDQKTYSTIEEMIQSETKLQEALKRLVYPS